MGAEYESRSPCDHGCDVIQRRLTWLRGPYHRYLRRGVLFALSGLMQRLPGSSLSFGPPRRTAHTSSAAGSQPGFARQVISPSERLVFDEPRSVTPEEDVWSLVEASPDLGRLRRNADGARYHDIPSSSIYTLAEGRVLGPEGWIVDARDALITDLSADYLRERYIQSRHPLMNRLRLPPAQSIQGSVAVLATLSARDYYGHWMMDLLPRATMLKRGGIRFEDLAGVYLPKPRHQYQLDMLTRLGVDPDQIIDADVVPHLRAGELIVPSCYANVFIASGWCCETLRALVPRPPAGPGTAGRLIYVSRSDTTHRRLVNEAELLRDVLEPSGFVPVWPERLTLAQQAAVFASADVVVSPLGSSVANLIQCRPGTQIVEIMNPRCVQPCALAIASRLGFDHHVVLAPGVDSTQHEINEDLFVPRVRLERAIAHALARSRGIAPDGPANSIA